MLLYDCEGAPSPRRVTLFAAEKGITLPRRQVNLREGEQFAEAFRAVNPACTVPALVLDDGTAITESEAICRYLEVRHPDPPLMGTDAQDQARVTERQRWVEMAGLQAVMEGFRNEAPGFRDRALPGPDPVAQIPALAERGRLRYARFLEALDGRLQESAWVAGEGFSIADITALVTVDFARRALRATPEEGQRALQAWYARMNERPAVAGSGSD